MASAETFAGMGQRIDGERRNRAIVRIWLYGICLLILAMVMVGGATRLTDSGLSITEWQPVHGVIPPFGDAAWAEEFEKYKQIPEYREINSGMSLSEFKTIYWWEWSHRFLGRFIGLAFALPLAWLWLTRRLEPRLRPRLLALLGLGAFQGFVGWWMVASGLVDRTDVSQYRLAIHLTLACGIFAGALWLARGLAPHSAGPATPLLARLAGFVTAAILLQIFLGGLVAGLDAGLAFNDWPTMDGAIVPADIWILEPAWRNLFENPKTVQFVHRTGAYALLVFIAIQWIVTARSGAQAPHRRRAALMLALALAQAAIGVAVLVAQVPFSLAMIHQAGAVVLLAFAVAHWRALVGPYSALTAMVTRC